MKVKGFIASLLLMACAQTMFAQKVTLHLSNNQKVEYNILHVDSITIKGAQPANSSITIIDDVWDVIQYYSAFLRLKEYIEKQKPGILFYNKDYVPLKGGENWDMVLKCFNAQINEGDSAFTIMALNYEAWDKALQKLAPLYKYPNKYEDKIKGDKGQIVNITRIINDPDSLAKLSMEMDITSPLVFKQNEQPEDGSYLVSAHGDTLRNEAVTWIKNIPLHTPSCGTGKGYCYEVRNWAMPKEWYFPDVEVEINDKAFYNTSNTESYFKVGKDTKKFDFDNSRYADIADKYGHVGNNDFYWLEGPNIASNPHVEIKLTNNIMSGKYDVYAVMVPYWYCRLDEEGFADSIRNDQAFVDSISANTKMSLKARIRYNINSNSGRDDVTNATQTFEYDGSKVDTIKIFEDFEFPYSYKNLRYSYPTLIIEGGTKYSGSTTPKNGFIHDLNIDRIILKSKEE